MTDAAYDDPDAAAAVAQLSSNDSLYTGDADAKAAVDALTKKKEKPAPVKFDSKGRVVVPNTPAHLNTVSSLALQNLSGLGATILGGFKGLKSLVTGKGAEQAGQDVSQYVQEHTINPEPNTAASIISKGLSSGANPLTWPSRFANLAGDESSQLATQMGASPETAGKVGATVNTGIQAIPLVLGFKGAQAISAKQAEAAANAPKPDVQAQLNQTMADKSVGAASTAPDLSKASPELQAKVADSLKKGQTINPETLSRHIEADTLPIPVPLTKGQAMQDVDVISQEMNNRGASGLSKVYKAQNDALVANIQELRDKAGPDVFSTNPVEHGDTLIGAYKAKAAVADADISAKYQALKDANGGQFPVDAPTLLNNATEALHKDLLFDHAPPAIMRTLNRLADSNNMTFENFESLRTNLARIQRSMSADGNEKAAAGIIRDSMEQLPLSPTAANLKPLADEARSAARTQFQALEADPAYKAAVNDAVSPDKFVHKFIVSAPRDSVAKMTENLADNPTAKQTIGVSVIDHLKSAAGIDRQGNGNFSQSMFNKNFEQLGPKIPYVLDPESAKIAEQIGNVARYTQVRPKGSYVNESNTLVGAIAEGAKSGIEGAVNVAAKGIPVGTWVRKAAQSRSAAKEFSQTIEPGAGISEPTKLSTLMRPKK
jgi:hypothetical protein